VLLPAFPWAYPCRECESVELTRVWQGATIFTPWPCDRSSWLQSASAAAFAFVASDAEAHSSGVPAWVTTAKQRLANLKTKAAGSVAGYQPRTKSFGPAWYDVDLNSCDTRNDALARDLAQVVYRGKSRCRVAKGTLKDPYTGKTINFVQGKTSSAVQIDHVVALADAWRTGG
jgi:hypothetical protein